MILGTAIILGTIATVFAVYFATRYVLGAESEEQTQALAASVLFRISALHGLVLALVFASEIVEYRSLAFEGANEVNAIADIYYDAARYGDAALGVRDNFKAYLRIVAEEEWPRLAETGDLSSDAWIEWDAAYETILNLAPDTARQEDLRDKMLANIDLIAHNRDLRQHHAKTALGSVFWVAALIGVLMVSVGYYCFPPKRQNVVLLTVFAAYTGLILLTIYAMSNPFKNPAALEPRIYLELLAEIES